MFPIGEIDQETEQEIEILKCATLLRQLTSDSGDTYQITYQARTYQVVKLDAETERIWGAGCMAKEAECNPAGLPPGGPAEGPAD